MAKAAEKDCFGGGGNKKSKEKKRRRKTLPRILSRGTEEDAPLGSVHL